MTSVDAITPYADLDELLVELVARWQRILGDDLVGAYVQGPSRSVAEISTVTATGWSRRVTV